MKTDSIQHLGIEQRLGLLERVASFRFSTADGEEFTVEQKGIPENPDVDRWAIMSQSGRCCYARNGEWVWEPQPSSRTDAFYEATRYTLVEALERAEMLEKKK